MTGIEVFEARDALLADNTAPRPSDAVYAAVAAGRRLFDAKDVTR